MDAEYWVGDSAPPRLRESEALPFIREAHAKSRARVAAVGPGAAGWVRMGHVNLRTRYPDRGD